jgi:hypothetical protein
VNTHSKVYTETHFKEDQSSLQRDFSENLQNSLHCLHYCCSQLWTDLAKIQNVTTTALQTVSLGGVRKDVEILDA